MKTSDLIGATLDWAVAKCENAGLGALTGKMLNLRIAQGVRPAPYSTDWSQGGPIIERERIDIQAKFNSGSNIAPKGQWYWQALVDENDVAHWFDAPPHLWLQ